MVGEFDGFGLGIEDHDGSYLLGKLQPASDSLADRFDLQIIRDIPQVKTAAAAISILFRISLSLKQLARGLHVVFRTATPAALLAARAVIGIRSRGIFLAWPSSRGRATDRGEVMKQLKLAGLAAL